MLEINNFYELKQIVKFDIEYLFTEDEIQEVPDSEYVLKMSTLVENTSVRYVGQTIKINKHIKGEYYLGHMDTWVLRDDNGNTVSIHKSEVGFHFPCVVHAKEFDPQRVRTKKVKLNKALSEWLNLK